MVECQLPKLDVAGSTPVSRSKSTAYRASKILPPVFTPLSGQDALFELLRRFGPRGESGLRINIQRDANPVASLVGGYFRIDTGLVSKTDRSGNVRCRGCHKHSFVKGLR